MRLIYPDPREGTPAPRRVCDNQPIALVLQRNVELNSEIELWSVAACVVEEEEGEREQERERALEEKELTRKQ